MLTSKDLGLELDPARVASPDELQRNALQLQIVVKAFIDDICASSSKIPSSFRKICNIVSRPFDFPPSTDLWSACPCF